MLKQSKGFSMIELLIASSIGIAALSAVIKLHSSISAHTSRQLQTNHLRNTLQDILFLMETDIQRSGYWNFDTVTEQFTDNPFQSDANDISITAYNNEIPGSCVLYSYDLDKDGQVGIGNCNNKNCPEGADSDNVEQLGFRLKDEAIQMRYGGTPFECNSGRWQALTEKQITVTSLNITEHNHCINLSVPDTDCMPEHNQQLIRNIAIEISARIDKSDIPEISISKNISLKNDRIIIATAQP